MPLYEYACQNCGHQFETRQRISDEPLKTCPKCSKDTLERLVSATSFTLKGSGWYADGYGGGSKKSGGDGASSAKDSGSGASETKPASSDKPKTEPAKTKVKVSDSGD
jgi:putative FmdB family regulatory protein